MSRIHRRNPRHGRRRAERRCATPAVGRGAIVFDEISHWNWAEEFRSKNPEYIRSLEQLSRRGR